jgi:hypothetical protein
LTTVVHVRPRPDTAIDVFPLPPSYEVTATTIAEFAAGDIDALVVVVPPAREKPLVSRAQALATHHPVTKPVGGPSQARPTVG